MRLIDADKLNVDFYDEYETEDDEYTHRYVSEHQIDTAPSIDIVRCGECKYDGTWKCPWRNTQVPRYPSADDFCSYGCREGE